jgi:hypothetical protein
MECTAYLVCIDRADAFVQAVAALAWRGTAVVSTVDK